MNIKLQKGEHNINSLKGTFALIYLFIAIPVVVLLSFSDTAILINHPEQRTREIAKASYIRKHVQLCVSGFHLSH